MIIMIKVARTSLGMLDMQQQPIHGFYFEFRYSVRLLNCTTWPVSQLAIFFVKLAKKPTRR